MNAWDDNGSLSFGEPCESLSSSYETDQAEAVELSPRKDANSYYQLMARAYGTVSPSSRRTPLKSNLSRTKCLPHYLDNEGQSSILTMNYDDQLYGYDEPLERPTSPSDASAALSYHSGLLSASSSGSTEEDDLGSVNALLLGGFGVNSNNADKNESTDGIQDLIDIPDTLNEFTDAPTIPVHSASALSMSYLPNHLSPDNKRRELNINLRNRPSSPPLDPGATFQEFMVDLDQMKQEATLERIKSDDDDNSQ